MKGLVFCLMVSFLLSGCINDIGNKNSQEILSYCSNASLDGIKPEIDPSRGEFSLPAEGLKAINLGGWEVANAYSGCHFGNWKGENKNYLYCSNSLRAIKSDSGGLITDSEEIVLRTTFRKENSHFVLVEKECTISYLD